VYVGWGNLFSLLPHEIAGYILGVLMPILAVSVFFFVAPREDPSLAAVVEETRRHRSNVEVLSGSVARVVDEDRDSRRTIAEKLDGLAETLSVHRQALDGVLESRGVTSAQVAQALVTLKGAIDDVAGKVGMIHRRVEQSEPSEVDRHAAVIGVIDALLNDVSVAATGIVVRLMEAERQPKRDIRAFVQGLVNAYASGDKHVFFRVLNSRLAESPERMALLREQVSASPEGQRPVRRRAPSSRSASVRIVGDHVSTEEYTVIGTEEVPMDNRFGNVTMYSEHHFSRTASNRVSLQWSKATLAGLGLGGGALVSLRAEAEREIERSLGLEFDSTVTRSVKLRFAAAAGRMSRYRITWKQEVRHGTFEVEADGKRFEMPYLVTHGLSHIVESVAADENAPKQ